MTMMLRALIVTVLYFAAIISDVAAELPPEYSVTQINGHAVSVNNNGTVVGDIFINTKARAFIWDRGVLQPFDVPCALSTAAVVINDQNQIVVISKNSKNEFDVHLRDRTGRFTKLSNNQMGTPQINDINNNGQMVGSLWNNMGYFPETLAHLWNTPTQVVDLSSLLPINSGWKYLTDVYAINNFGVFVGSGFLDNYEKAYFRGQILNGILNIEIIDQDIDLTYTRLDINDSGSITGAITSMPGDLPEAFLFDKYGQLKQLGVLPGGLHSGGIKVNNCEHVLGYSDAPLSPFAYPSVIWDSKRGMRKISNLVSYTYRNMLGQAVDQNDRGQILFSAADGLYYKSYLLSPNIYTNCNNAIPSPTPYPAPAPE